MKTIDKIVIRLLAEKIVEHWPKEETQFESKTAIIESLIHNALGKFADDCATYDSSLMQGKIEQTEAYKQSIRKDAIKECLKNLQSLPAECSRNKIYDVLKDMLNV